MDGEPSDLLNRQHFVRILVFRHTLFYLLYILSICGVDCFQKCNIPADNRLRFHVCYEAGRDFCAVFVQYRHRSNDQRDAFDLCQPSGCQIRAEQEELNAPLLKVLADLFDDRKRRIIDNTAPVRIIETLIIATGPERTNHFFAFNSVTDRDIIGDRVINIFWRITVVCRLLRFKFFDEAFVIIELASLFSVCHLTPDFVVSACRRRHAPRYIDQPRCIGTASRPGI